MRELFVEKVIGLAEEFLDNDQRIKLNKWNYNRSIIVFYNKENVFQFYW